MKLYATVTSERASKGQGGNERLFVDVINEDREPIATVNIWVKDNTAEVMVRQWAKDKQDRYTIKLPTKGEKQKGKLCPLNHEWDAQGHCKNCPAKHCKCHK